MTDAKLLTLALHHGPHVMHNFCLTTLGCQPFDDPAEGRDEQPEPLVEVILDTERVVVKLSTLRGQLDALVEAVALNSAPIYEPEAQDQSAAQQAQAEALYAERSAAHAEKDAKAQADEAAATKALGDELAAQREAHYAAEQEAQANEPQPNEPQPNEPQSGEA